MITHLAKIVEGFPGSANRTRCFAHILNLVAKCIMRQFDRPGKQSDEYDESEVSAEEIEYQNESGEEDGSDSGKANDEPPFDGREGMTGAEIVELDENVRPVRLVLAKVRQTMVL